MDAARKRLHELVDSLPSQEVQAAERFLEFLREGRASANATPESLSAEEEAVIQAGLDELDRGEGVPAAQVYAELRAKFGEPLL